MFFKIVESEQRRNLSAIISYGEAEIEKIGEKLFICLTHKNGIDKADIVFDLETGESFFNETKTIYKHKTLCFLDVFCAWDSECEMKKAS